MPKRTHFDSPRCRPALSLVAAEVRGSLLTVDESLRMNSLSLPITAGADVVWARVPAFGTSKCGYLHREGEGCGGRRGEPTPSSYT